MRDYDKEGEEFVNSKAVIFLLTAARPPGSVFAFIFRRTIVNHLFFKE